jgi:thioredoxin reductase (NADPH)
MLALDEARETDYVFEINAIRFVVDKSFYNRFKPIKVDFSHIGFQITAAVDYDLVIIGGGPAGLTAGIYAARARLNVILIEKAVLGGQILVTDWIENYPGFPEGLCGAELVQKMTDQAEKFGFGIEANDVVSLDLAGTVKKIHLTDKTISARALIIATGASPRKLGIPGEKKLFDKGVSTCATCDGPFYRDQIVVAAGGGDTAVQESLFLTKFARDLLFLVHRRDQLRATKILQERAFNNDRLEIIWNSMLTEIDISDIRNESFVTAGTDEQHMTAATV